MKKTIKKTTQLVTVLFLLLITVLSALYSPIRTNAEYVAIADNALDNTDPIADLSGDESFDITKYPFNVNGKISLLSFNEYCYSFYEEKRANFAIYLYVYNPAALDIVDSSLNKIEMAVGYDGDGKPNDYERFELKLCSVSGGNYARLIYKFKVVDHLVKGLTIYDRLNSNKRRYDVAGIELISSSAVNATDNNVSKTFYFTGYAKGYGPDYAAPDSTLKCEYENLESIELNVKHTYWRSKTSDRGAGYRNQLDTVYFSIPNRFLRDYGKLQRIKAEWYEYLTKDIVVTSNQEFYNAARGYMGVNINEYNSNIGLSLGQDTIYNSDDAIVSWGWNLGNYYYQLEALKTLYYLFPTKNWCDIKNYDPYASVEKSGGVSSSDLLDYIYSYNKTYETGTVKDGKISADLFESDIESYRKIDNEFGKIQYGYSYYDFDADVDLFELKAYSPDNHDFWDNVAMYDFWAALWGSYGTVEQSFTEQTPILLLNKSEYLAGNNQDVSDRLFVNYNDVDKIKAAVTAANINDETVVLFRFAVSDYYAADIEIIDVNRGFLQTDDITFGQAYRAKESVFLDFDIIQLTFNKDGVLTVIPVVSSPIDIVDDITPPYTPPSAGDNTLAWIVFCAAVVVGVILLGFALKYIEKTVDSGMSVIIKLFIIIFIITVLAVIAYFAVPFIAGIIKDLGGI